MPLFYPLTTCCPPLKYKSGDFSKVFRVDKKSPVVYPSNMPKKPAKKARGRPVATDPLKKRYFRATDDQWEMFVQASDGNVGQWIRETCLRAAKRKLK